LLHNIPWHAWTDSQSRRAASGTVATFGAYIGRASARTSNSSTSAPACDAPSSATRTAARLVDCWLSEPPRATILMIMRLAPLWSKHVMDERDGDRPLADGGRHTLDVAAPHVTNRKDSRAVRFEQVRPACVRPVRREIIGREIRPGFHET